MSNSIFSNTGLGIDLGADGVTLNDPGDGDTGPNGLQNFPVLTSNISSAGITTISGNLNSIPSKTFNLDFFANSSCDPSNNGEGETLLGSKLVTTGGGGNVDFVAAFATAVPAGQAITATATDPTSNTSEFSPCETVIVDVVSITSGPSGSPDPVESSGSADLSVSANDTIAHPLGYSWSASCSALPSNGSFNDPNIQDPVWTAPSNTTGSSQNCTISVTVSDEFGNSDLGNYTHGVSSQIVTPTPTPSSSGGGGGGSRPPEIDFRPDNFTFEYTKGTAPPELQVIRIWNSSRGGTLRFSVSSDVDWLEFDPFEEISSDDDDKEDIEISIDVDDLEEGTFEAVLTIEARRARNNPQTALVTLIVLGRPSIFLSRQEISFRGVAGDASPPSEIVELSNIGLQPLAWTVETDEPWLLVNPESGVLEQAVAPVTISIFADLAGLDPGRHLASLIVSDPKADNDPQTISVELILASPTPTATPVPVVAFVAASAAVPTPLPIPTSTPSPTPSPTSTATVTPTQTATQIPSPVPTSTPTASPTPEPTLTPTPFIPSTDLLARSEGPGILRFLGGPIGAIVVGLFGVSIVGYAVREIFFT